MAAQPDARRPRRFSIWTALAPLALLGAVSVLVVIAQGAGWVGSKTASKTTPKTSKRHTTKPPPAKHRTRTRTQAIRLRYKVQAGDTFGSISVRFHTTIAQLQALNPGVDSSRLTIGQDIRIR